MPQQNRGRLIESIVWFAFSVIAALVLRRDLEDASDLQIEIGKSIAFTAAAMVFPTYGMSLGIGSVIQLILRRSKLDRLLQPATSSLAERVLELAFLAVGVWTVGMIAAIDVVAGIMALVVLFSHVLINDFGRMPGGAFLSGCATWLVGIQLLLIGGTLLSIYSAHPFGEEIGIGPIVAMLAPGLRMIIGGIIGLVSTFRRARRGGLTGIIQEVSGVDVNRLQDLAASFSAGEQPGSADPRTVLSSLFGNTTGQRPQQPPVAETRDPSSRLADLAAELQSRMASGDPRQAPTDAEIAELTRLAEQQANSGDAPGGA